MQNDLSIVSPLRKLLDAPSTWGKRIEQFAAEYGQLQPADVPSLPEEKIQRLWWASPFAETGSYGLSKPSPEQLQGLRNMTTLLADRETPLGDRFCSAREECAKTFSKPQLPVILRALLILEGGLFGTITTKTSTNLLLKWAGKSELNYSEAASITLALENVRTLIDQWAPKVAAKNLGERARIPWYLCEIIKAGDVGAQPLVVQAKNWRFGKWMGPLLDALRALGGSGTPKAAGQKIRETLGLPDSDVAVTNKSGQTKFYNEVAWARKNLVWEGLIGGEERGIWTLTEKGKLKFLGEEEAQSIVEKWASHYKHTADEKLEDDISNLQETANEIIASAMAIEKAAPFTKADALKDLFMSEPYLDTVLARLKRKKALILQGPPGVGKTFIAQRLAFATMVERDTTRVTMVQFHPSYGYDDFVQGFRPTATGLERRDGVFHRFAQSARQDPNRDWFFIIDEINRGNLAKIFGELLMLIEADKRGQNHAVPLTYSDGGETFYLPANLYVIGTMNTADRSLAMVDYALRRRFSFVSLEPKLDTTAFADWLKARGASDVMVARIRTKIGALNEVIEKERDLGRGFRIGHSFFCPPDEHLPDDSWYREVIEGEIQPLLEEYFDSPDHVQKLVTELLAD